jgi:hypothetical protein
MKGLKGRDHSEDLDVDGRIILECFLRKMEVGRCGVVGGWRRFHNEELHNLYASPNSIRVIKSRRMGWTGHVAQIKGMRNSYAILVG